MADGLLPGSQSSFLGAQQSGGSSGGDPVWASYMTRRLKNFVGFTENSFATVYDSFSYPGGTDFGERWLRGVLGGGFLDHGNVIAGGVKSGGNCVIGNGSSDFAGNYLLWNGPSLVSATINTTRLAMGLRWIWMIKPADSAFLDAQFGFVSPGGVNYIFFGMLGGASLTNWVIRASTTPSDLVTAVARQNVLSVSQEMIIALMPDNLGNKTVKVWLDGSPVGTLTLPAAQLSDLIPQFGCNKGAVQIDDVLVAFPAAT